MIHPWDLPYMAGADPEGVPQDASLQVRVGHGGRARVQVLSRDSILDLRPAGVGTGSREGMELGDGGWGGGRQDGATVLN